jgi:6-phosphogluconate dehydrogenase
MTIQTDKPDFGMIGLGTMGRNFLLNIADSGIPGVGYDLDAAKRQLLIDEGSGLPVYAAETLEELVARLERPRNLMLLVPAGPIVDSVIAQLTPLLDAGDVIIDGGNSHFSDTERRERELAEKGVGFMGIGVSGGEAGARHGASIMPGGMREHYERLEATLQAVAAKVNGEACVAYMGSGSAGHFVKMVHNGIEYGLMQLICESYDLLRRGYGLSLDEVADLFTHWNAGELNSFLMEITATVLRKEDEQTGQPLVEVILDTAGQKGTGKWTSQAAMDLSVPIPTIDSAVSMRQISAQKAQRVQAAERLSRDDGLALALRDDDIELLKEALYTAFIATYSQGFSLLRTASDEKGYGLDLAEIAKIWRGGCIIRAALLEDIRQAFAAEPGIQTLLVSNTFSEVLKDRLESLEYMVQSAISVGVPCMCAASTLNYIRAMTTERLPANLLQAQRDYFGAHTYQRIDADGTFHTANWES